MKSSLELSCLGHTWIIDLDGTIVKHNGYKIDGYDTFLEGAKLFLAKISEKDMVIFITSREECFRPQIEQFLYNNNIKYNYLICGAPYGERILINDEKPSGLKTALAINLVRDNQVCINVKENRNI